MNRTTRRTLGLAASIVALVVAMAPALAGEEAYPARPIRMLLGFPAGSGTDSVARVIGKAMGDRLGQPIVIENRAGAGGTIASDAVAKARNDGYTLLTASSSISISPAMYAKLPFDTEADLTAVGYIGALPTVLLVNTKTMPVKSLAEFTALLKSKPDTFKFGSSGVGGSTHLFTEFFQHMTGTRARHIPYKGGSQDVVALRTGEIDFLFETLILALPILQAPDILPLAITGPQRSPTMPNVSTFAEAGLPEFQAEAYFGVLGPAGMPVAAVDKLNATLNDALKDPEVVARLSTAGGMRLGGGAPRAFTERIHNDIATWQQIVRDASIKPQ